MKETISISLLILLAVMAGAWVFTYGAESIARGIAGRDDNADT